MKWFRMYAEARTDAKLRALTAEQFRVWFALLCFASEQDETECGRGSIVGYDDDLLAVEVAEGDTTLLRETIDRLTKLRIIREDEQGLTFIHFEQRQYDKPSDRPGHVAERVRQYRERQRNGQVTPSNAL